VHLLTTTVGAGPEDLYGVPGISAGLWLVLAEAV
jgi:hypothetical protein